MNISKESVSSYYGMLPAHCASRLPVRHPRTVFTWIKSLSLYRQQQRSASVKIVFHSPPLLKVAAISFISEVGGLQTRSANRDNTCTMRVHNPMAVFGLNYTEQLNLKQQILSIILAINLKTWVPLYRERTGNITFGRRLFIPMKRTYKLF